MNLDAVKKYFPKVFEATDVKGLIIALVIYAVIAFVGGLVLGLLSIIPILGFIFSVLAWVLRVYCAVAIILAILVFIKVVK